MRHLLSNSPDRLIAHLEPTAELSVAQLWILREGLGDPLNPKLFSQLLDRGCLDSLAKFFPGRSRIGAVNPAPKGEAEVVLPQPLKRLWTAFLSIHQSVNQDRCGKFLERVHKIGIVIFPTPPDLEVSPFFFMESDSVSFQYGENQVKTRYQNGYFWTLPVQGNEQWVVRAHVPCHIEVVQ